MFSSLCARTFSSFTSTVIRPIFPSFRPLQHSRSFSSTSITMAREWRLKNVTGLSMSNLDKFEAEVEGIEGGKVLVVKVNDKVHALNANCTHFGAPLKNGVVTPDGRITCPWHGACFSVATGDVEDAPAPDHLNRFDVVEKDGKVYIKAEEQAVKSGRRKPDVKLASVADDEKVVVVGGGSGAFGAVQKLREHKFRGSITLIGNEGLPIDRTKLSKALITDASKVQLRDEKWFNDASITQVNDAVTGVDFDGKAVKTKSGSTYPYTKLILASGGTPKMLPLPGFKDLKNIFVLRHVTDTKAIMDAIGDKGKKIVIVGSSFIGMEVGNALAKDNEVKIIGMESAPLERVMGKEVGNIFRKNLEKNGVKFYMDAEVDSAYPSSKGGSVGGVKLKDGTSLDADLVILGIGVSPATEYLKDNSKVTLEKDKSISVDDNFAVKGLTNVWAVGDIATYPYKGPGGNGKPVRIEHWNVAQNMGRSVGARIGGDTPQDFIPIFWSALGAQLRYCGHTPDGYDELILKGEPNNGKFAAYYAKGDEIVAVATMGMDPIMVKCAELMRAGKMLSKADLKADKDPLKA